MARILLGGLVLIGLNGANAGPVALGVDPAQSRTNHPVLFVHGINSGMETWGAEVVDLAEQGCELAMDKVRIDVESKWSEPWIPAVNCSLA